MIEFGHVCRGGTRDDGHLAQEALRDAGDEHDALQAHLHIRHQLLVLLVLRLVVHQRAALALPAIGREFAAAGIEAS